MKTDTMLLVAIAIMLALGLIGMYQWRPIVKFVRDMWIPAAAPEVRTQLLKIEDERKREYLEEHRRQEAEKQRLLEERQRLLQQHDS